MALVYLWGRKAAKQEDRIREQEDALKDQEKAAQTMQAMQEAAIKAPASREELLASLKQGRF